MQIHSNGPSNFKSIFEALEERVLFDGVPDATFVLPQADSAEPVPAQVQDLQQSSIDAPRELILVDAGVENSDQLLSEILESKPNSLLEVRVLDANSNGVDQISAILSESETKYDAIHIISHGDEGEVNLSNSTLSADNLNRYAGQLAGWADALTEDADLLFYGCDLAGNAEGEQFIESISTMTGADVAASDDLTGAADLGGDWDLELNVGTVETRALSATAFAGVLATDTDGDGVDDLDDADKDGDGILNVDEVSFTPVPVNIDGQPTTLNGTAIGGGHVPVAIGDEIIVSDVATLLGTDLDVRFTVVNISGTGAGLTYNAGNAQFSVTPFNPLVDPHAEIQIDFVESGTSNAVSVSGLSSVFRDIDSNAGQDFTEVIGFDPSVGVTLGANLGAVNYVNGGGLPGLNNFGSRPDIAGSPTDFLAEPNSATNDVAHFVEADFGNVSSTIVSIGVTGSHVENDPARARRFGFDGFEFLALQKNLWVFFAGCLLEP